MIENFPVYRKYSNNKNYFKIISFKEFYEILFIGKKIILKKFEAKIYPDKLFIVDLINCNSQIIEIFKEEFTQIESQISTELE